MAAATRINQLFRGATRRINEPALLFELLVAERGYSVTSMRRSARDVIDNNLAGTANTDADSAASPNGSAHAALRTFLIQRLAKAGLTQAELGKRLGQWQSFVARRKAGPIVAEPVFGKRDRPANTGDVLRFVLPSVRF
jgi:hypothetical protein